MEERPLRTNTKITGDVGETSALLLFRKFGWVADFISSDYGEDLDCNIFLENQRTNLHFRCQVKSSTKDSEYVQKLNDGSFSVSIKSSILKTWLVCSFPVLLIVYEQDNDKLYWSLPVEQILSHPSKLSKENPSIRVSNINELNLSSVNNIVNVIQGFYKKLLRIDETLTECEIIPIIMPDYKLVPFRELINIEEDNLLKLRFRNENMELLPSWMTVLKKIEASSYINQIGVSSKSSTEDLNNFLKILKNVIKTFEIKRTNNEWLSFIISPIRLKSIHNETWLNELTYWISFSLLQEKVVNDFDYTFMPPENFLRKVARRARSWDYYHFVNPNLDIAIQLFGILETTPTIKLENEIHKKHIQGQFILWNCNKNELKKIQQLIFPVELVVKIISEENEKSLIIITSPFFDPFLGLYSSANDWEEYDNGSVLTKLSKKNILLKLPGEKYTGKIPDFFYEALENFFPQYSKNVLIDEEHYIPGFPIKHDQRMIKISRFQMLKNLDIKLIEDKIEKINSESKERSIFSEFNMEFLLIDDSWQHYIYELSISWQPFLNESSKDSFNRLKNDIIIYLDMIMPSAKNSNFQLKDTFEILKFAGEIYFEETNFS